MRHSDNPRSLRSVNACKIFGKPSVLRISLVVLVTSINGTERSRIRDVSLAFLGCRLISFQICDEWRLGAAGEVGFGVERNEVCEAVVKRVPEVANASCLGSGHAETVLICGEVSAIVRESDMKEANIIESAGHYFAYSAKPSVGIRLSKIECSKDSRTIRTSRPSLMTALLTQNLEKNVKIGGFPKWRGEVLYAE